MCIKSVKAFLGTALLSASLHSTAIASVDSSQVYVGAGGSGVHEFDVSDAKIDYDLGYGYSGKIGFIPNSDGLLQHLRFEGEYVEQGNNLTRESNGGEGESTLYAAMINAYYDFPAYKGVRPYIGVGGGYAEVELKGKPSFGVIKESDEGIGLQAMAGLTYIPTSLEKTQFYVGYRLFGVTRELSFDDISGGKERGYYLTQSVEMGITYRF